MSVVFVGVENGTVFVHVSVRTASRDISLSDSAEESQTNLILKLSSPMEGTITHAKSHHL